MDYESPTKGIIEKYKNGQDLRGNALNLRLSHLLEEVSKGGFRYGQ